MKPSMILKSIIMLSISPLCYLLSARSFDVLSVNIYFLVYILFTVFSTIFLWKKAPDLVEARMQRRRDVESWDKLLVVILLLLLSCVIPFVAGFDAGNYDFLIPILIGYFMFFLGSSLQVWAMITNRHFEGLVRIQHDRDHKVITDGPYKIVRHPGYLGISITAISIPLMMGSLYALIPSFLVVLDLFIRAVKEENFLAENLEGYKEFKEKVKYRVIPFVW